MAKKSKKNIKRRKITGGGSGRRIIIDLTKDVNEEHTVIDLTNDDDDDDEKVGINEQNAAPSTPSSSSPKSRRRTPVVDSPRSTTSKSSSHSSSRISFESYPYLISTARIHSYSPQRETSSTRSISEASSSAIRRVSPSRSLLASKTDSSASFTTRDHASEQRSSTASRNHVNEQRSSTASSDHASKQRSSTASRNHVSEQRSSIVSDHTRRGSARLQNRKTEDVIIEGLKYESCPRIFYEEGEEDPENDTLFFRFESNRTSGHQDSSSSLSSGNPHVFAGNLFTAKCEKEGCERMVQLTKPYCREHLEEVYGLRVAESSIQGGGFGVFATRRISKGTPLFEYKGEDLTQEEVDERYGKGDVFAPYTYMNANNGFIKDAALDRQISSFINQDRGRANVVSLLDEDRIVITTKKNIKAGEELFLDYRQNVSDVSGIRYHTCVKLGKK